MNSNESIVSDLSCFVLAGLILVGLIGLAVKLHEVQVNDSADYNYANARQSVRRVQTAGRRGRLLARDGTPLADSRRTFAVVCDASAFQQRTWPQTEAAVSSAIVRVSHVIGRPSTVTGAALARHVKQRLARPLLVWHDLSDAELARFSEHGDLWRGFACIETEARDYPFGPLAAHVLGYVGRDKVDDDPGDAKINFRDDELRGRSGLENFYDIYLRGVPGEDNVLVDARGFAIRSWTVRKPQRGPDLQLTLDISLQEEAERALAGEKGACVVLDPRNGEILAFASAPAYDLNRCVPILTEAHYRTLVQDPNKPLLNRASGGTYAPGSTFKPITALAGLAAGLSDAEQYECTGVFCYGTMHLHCSRTWGHGPMDLRHALMKSCNPYFCNLGLRTGTNGLFAAARAFGLGARTGLDLGVDSAGAVPDAAWKTRVYNMPWYPGDLAQTAIGQGMLLVTPLQMARVAGALATGRLVTPHFNRNAPVESRPLPFPAAHLETVRAGMRLVVTGDRGETGTGARGAEGVSVAVAGKTGTAEVGSGDRRRKNTWFIAYAPYEAPRVAVAMVIENGQSGGGTTAPRVAAILRKAFGDSREEMTP